MAKKSLKEAGNYDRLTAQEKQMLAHPEVPVAVRNSLAAAVSGLRSKGKNVSLLQAAQQMRQIPQFANDPGLSKFIAGASFGMHTLKPQGHEAAQKLNNTLNPQQRPLPPMQQGPTPGEEFEKMRTGPVSNDDMLAQQRPQMGGLRQQRSQQSPGINPLAPTQPGMPQTRPGMGQPRPMAGQMQPNQPTMQGMPQPGQVARKVFKKPVAEAMNPGMMAGPLRNILKTISTLKPEELSAIAGMVNSLMANKRGRTGMGTTMESKKLVTEALKVKLTEQVQARNTAHRILSESPLASIWDKIKGAGSALGGQMGMAGQMGQQAQTAGVDENSKRVAQELTKALGKVNQFRQKFNSSILKNSEAMNGYHDLVLQVVQMYQQNQHMLGPFGQQLVRQIHDAVGNLVYDLKSEKEQIDTFLKQLKDAGMAKIDTKSADGSAMIKGPQQASMDPSLLGAAAKKRAQASRVEENPGGTAGLRRNMPQGGAAPRSGQQLDSEMMQRASDDFQQHLGPHGTDGEGNFQKFYNSFVKNFKNKKKPSKKKKTSGKK